MGGGRASRLAIKEGDLFLYTNELGQVPGTENSVLGLYYRDTRYLSRYELTIAGRQPVLLSASADRGYAATVELTNLEARTADGHTLPQAQRARAPHALRLRPAVRAPARAQLPPARRGARASTSTSTRTSPTCSRSAAAAAAGAARGSRRGPATAP